MEAPIYDGLNKTLTYNFVLDKNVDYTIDIVHANAQPDFSISISQNNWVYAPNGGEQRVVQHSDDSWTPYFFGGSLSSDEYYLSENMLYAVMANLIGTKCDLSDIEDIDNIMSNLGYDRSEYTVTGEDVIVTIGTDAALLLSVYNLGASIAGNGYLVAIFGDYAAKAGAASLGITGMVQVIATPNINLINKILNHWEKNEFKDALEDSCMKMGEYNIYRTENYNTQMKFWNVWATAPYIRKINVMGDLCKVIPYTFEDLQSISDTLGWE